jgi:hypothetical protein
MRSFGVGTIAIVGSSGIAAASPASEDDTSSSVEILARNDNFDLIKVVVENDVILNKKYKDHREGQIDQVNVGAESDRIALQNAENLSYVQVTERYEDFTDRLSAECEAASWYGNHYYSGTAIQFTRPADAIGKAGIVAALEVALISTALSKGGVIAVGALASIILALSGDTFTVGAIDVDTGFGRIQVVQFRAARSWQPGVGNYTDTRGMGNSPGHVYPHEDDR